MGSASTIGFCNSKTTRPFLLCDGRSHERGVDPLIAQIADQFRRAALLQCE